MRLNMKESIKLSFYVSTGIASVIFVFYSVVELMAFLSIPNFQPTASNADPVSAVSWSLFFNTGLISLFIFQHSILAVPGIKRFYQKYDLQVFERSVYVVSTALILLLLIRNWHEIPHILLWKYNYSKSLWLLFTVIQISAWLIIYTGNICMDINELLGLKQIYYRIRQFPDPNSCKSYELKKLNQHMRHPSFMAFLMIFWAVPVMSLDRLLLASILSLYMYLAWNTDNEDYNYQEMQHERKFHELEQL